MALCVTTSGGNLVLVDPQPSDVGACSMLVVSGSDYLAATNLGGMFNMSLQDATDIFAAGAMLWGVAFVWRLLRRQAEAMLSTDEP